MSKNQVDSLSLSLSLFLPPPSLPLSPLPQERDKALEEVGSCKKELKVKSEKIHSLMAELEKERKKNAELASELEQVEDHRNRLLDKVERIHADKHNLEARYSGSKVGWFRLRAIV